MDKVIQSQANLRKRKMMLLLPVLIIPFITLAFWAIGGSKINAGKQTDAKNSTGLNLHLPDPKLKKETILDKLGFYDKAEKDSLKLKQEMRYDPYYLEQLSKGKTDQSNDLEKIVQNSAGKFHQSSITEENKLNTSPYNTNPKYAEEKLIQKIAELNKAINRPQIKPTKADEYSYLDNDFKSDPNVSTNVERL